GVTGLVNMDLTRELAAKTGAALGATLPKGTYIANNRYRPRSSPMVKRALHTGMPDTGLHVLHPSTNHIPGLRQRERTQPDTSAGIHGRLSPFDQRVVDIRFIDTQGMNLSKKAVRRVEQVYFREDFRRAYLDEIGLIDYSERTEELYIEDF